MSGAQTETRTMLISAGGTVVFGAGTFVLHRLVISAPALTAGEIARRTAEIGGYILPAGSTEAERAAAMESARRRIVRAVCAADGFTLSHGGKSLALTAEQAPEFSAEAPLNGTDAAYVTIRARTAGDSAFLGGGATVISRGYVPQFAFPAAIAAGTVFGVLARAGTLNVENTGDLPCGFLAEITAEGGGLTSVTLALGGKSLTVAHPLAEGERLLIDTRTGSKNVTAQGVSVMGEVDPDSDFFPLQAGENPLSWESEGFGTAVMRLSFTPRYL